MKIRRKSRGKIKLAKSDPQSAKCNSLFDVKIFIFDDTQRQTDIAFKNLFQPPSDQ